MSAAYTRAPSAARASAQPRPIPLAAPVTSAVFPLTRPTDSPPARFDLRRHIRFGAPAESLVYDEAAGLWQVRAAGQPQVTARFVVTATGNLSRPNWPAIPGLGSFEGALWHTATWPPEGVDFAGRR